MGIENIKKRYIYYLIYTLCMCELGGVLRLTIKGLAWWCQGFRDLLLPSFLSLILLVLSLILLVSSSLGHLNPRVGI